MSLPATSTNTINMQINDGIQKPSGKADVGLMAYAARAPLATVCSIELVTTASFIDRNYESATVAYTILPTNCHQNSPLTIHRDFISLHLRPSAKERGLYSSSDALHGHPLLRLYEVQKLSGIYKNVSSFSTHESAFSRQSAFCVQC